MNSLNSVILEGIVESVKTSDSKDLFPNSPTTLKISTQFYYKDKDGNTNKEISYFDVLTYGGLSEIAGRKSKKGSRIRVVGRLKQERWKDADGNIHSKAVVIAEHIEFCKGVEE